MFIVILKPMLLNTLIIFFSLSLCVPLVCSIMPRPLSLYRPILPKPTILVILFCRNRHTRSQISASWKELKAMSKFESAFFFGISVLQAETSKSSYMNTGHHSTATPGSLNPRVALNLPTIYGS